LHVCGGEGAMALDGSNVIATHTEAAAEALHETCCKHEELLQSTGNQLPSSKDAMVVDGDTPAAHTETTMKALHEHCEHQELPGSMQELPPGAEGAMTSDRDRTIATHTGASTEGQHEDSCTHEAAPVTMEDPLPSKGVATDASNAAAVPDVPVTAQAGGNVVELLDDDDEVVTDVATPIGLAPACPSPAAVADVAISAATAAKQMQSGYQDKSRSRRLQQAEHSHSIEDPEMFAEFEDASGRERSDWPHLLASFYHWMTLGVARKSASNYTQNVRVLLQVHGKSVRTMASNQEYAELVRSCRENAKRNGIMNASLKKLQEFLAEHGTEGPWETKAHPSDAAFKIGKVALNSKSKTRPGTASITAHFAGSKGNSDRAGASNVASHGAVCVLDDDTEDALPTQAQPASRAVVSSTPEESKVEVSVADAAQAPEISAEVHNSVRDRMHSPVQQPSAKARKVIVSASPLGAPVVPERANKVLALASANGKSAATLQGLFATKKRLPNTPLDLEADDPMDSGESLAEATTVDSGKSHQGASAPSRRLSPSVNGIAGLFAQTPTGLLEIDVDDDEVDDVEKNDEDVGKGSKDNVNKNDGYASVAARCTSTGAGWNEVNAASPPGRGNTAKMQDETPEKLTAVPVPAVRESHMKLAKSEPVQDTKNLKPLSELPQAGQQEIERLRLAVNKAVKEKKFSEAQQRLKLLKRRCSEMGCVVPPRNKVREKAATTGAAVPPADPVAGTGNAADDAGEAEAEPSNRIDFARALLREKFHLQYPQPDAAEDDFEILPGGALFDGSVRYFTNGGVTGGGGGRKKSEVADSLDDGDGELRERAQAMKNALAKIADAPYDDIGRFPAVAATFRKFMEGERLEAADVETAVRTLHELFAQDEKSLDAMAGEAYAKAVAGDQQHAQVIGHFSRFWQSHQGPLAAPPPRAERGLEARMRSMHGIPMEWTVRVVQRAHKEDLVILTSGEGESHYATASQLGQLPLFQQPEFVAEQTRQSKAMAVGDQPREESATQPVEKRRSDRDMLEKDRLARVKQQQAELEGGLSALLADGSTATEGRRRVLSALFRQQAACSGCAKVSGKEADFDIDDLMTAGDTAAASAAVERTRWTSYEDVPDASEEEKKLYTPLLATFFTKGYPYVTGVKKLMELYRKRPHDMATAEFQRLVRHDPENAACNGFLNSAILYLRKFRDECGFENLIDISTMDPKKLQTFVPDFTRGFAREQEGFEDMQIEVPLELLMADATMEWQNELQEKLDDEGYIQEDVDASGHRPVALTIALLPAATDEDWALWPRILAKFEAIVRQESELNKAMKRDAEALELLVALKELVEEHGKSPASMASRKYVRIINRIYGPLRARAAGRFADFWQTHKDGEFPEPKVHALSASKYRLTDLRLVEEATRLASAWKLPEGWAARLGRDSRLVRVTGPGKGEVFSTKEAALEAVATKSRRQAEEAKEQQKQAMTLQDARQENANAQTRAQALLKTAIECEDYASAEKAHAELQKLRDEEPAGGSTSHKKKPPGGERKSSDGPCRAGTMPIIARDLAAPKAPSKLPDAACKSAAKSNGKQRLFGAKRKQPDRSATPTNQIKIRKKAAGLHQVQLQQAAACELTLRRLEWRVLGVRCAGFATLPLGSEEIANVRADRISVVLAYVDDEIRERKRRQIIESWGLDETWSVAIRLRRSGDQITVRRADGKVYFHKHELTCERQRSMKQKFRTHATECVNNLVQFLDSAATQEVWEFEVKSLPRLSGLYVRALGPAQFQKVRGMHCASATPGAEGISVRLNETTWQFSDEATGQVMAWTLADAKEGEVAAATPFMTSQLQLGQLGVSEQFLESSGRFLESGDVGAALAAWLAEPQGPRCKQCGNSGPWQQKSTHGPASAKSAASRSDKLALYELRLRDQETRRAAAPRTLPAMLGRMLQKLVNLEGSLPDGIVRKRKLRIGTMCSGTDAPVLVARALERALGERSGISFEHAFSAEKDVTKQDFLRANFPDCPYIFMDVCHMGRQRAFDAISCTAQPIPGDLDLLMAGFSCKDLSMMNSYRKTLAEMGTSGSTLRGVLDYIERYRPRMVLLENVWAIAKANQIGFRQVDLVMEGLRARGYASGYRLLNSCDYYVPQIRHRIWMWGIRIDGAPTGPGKDAEVMACAQRASHSVAPRFDAILTALEEPCALHFEDFMLDDDHPDVRAHFELVKSKQRTSVTMKKKGAKKDWTQKYGNHRIENDYQYERPYTGVRDAEFLHLLNPRERELVDLKCLDVLNEQGKDPRSVPMLWELTQSVERVPGTRVRRDRQNYATCILPGMLWHSSRHRWVLGIEKLALQGVFAGDLIDTKFSQKLLGDLAGNAFTTTVCAANLIAALACADTISAAP